jgi:hypothetical protein
VVVIIIIIIAIIYIPSYLSHFIAIIDIQVMNLHSNIDPPAFYQKAVMM